MGMRPTNDPFGGTGPLVDKLIGNAYDIVKHVAMNMAYVKHVSFHLEHVFTVSKNIQDVNTVAGQIDKVVTLAEQLDLPIHCHIHETQDEINGSLSEHKVRPLARLAALGLVGSWQETQE